MIGEGILSGEIERLEAERLTALRERDEARSVANMILRACLYYAQDCGRVPLFKRFPWLKGKI